MFRKFASQTYYAFLLCLSLFISACHQNEPTNPSDSFGSTETVVFETDSDEWHVRLLAAHVLYANAIEVQLPSPWTFPTREDALILHTLEYPSEERFVTSDGYTFAMPSASVTKAGQKTKYSVLGLWKRKTTYDIGF